MATLHIPANEIKFSSLSVGADDYGKVFYWNNRLFRGITEEAEEVVRDIFSNGLIDELVRNNLFPKSWITNYQLEGYTLVIEHEEISNVTYPYEWSISMLKEASLSILEISLIACKYKYQLKDCHGYNIIFDCLQPKFVDLGSFIPLKDNLSQWIAYDEFLRFYYYPLMMWSNGCSFLARRVLSSENEMMKHSEYLLYKYAYIRGFNSYLTQKIANIYLKFKKSSLNIEKLFCKIRDIKIGKNSELYRHQNSFYTATDLNSVVNIFKEYEINSVFEFSDGKEHCLSKLLLEQIDIYGAVKNITIAFQDELAMDMLYSKLRSIKAHATLVLLNFCFPNTIFSAKDPSERLKSDVIVFSEETLRYITEKQHLPFSCFFHSASLYTKRYVLFSCSHGARFTSETNDFQEISIRNRMSQHIRFLLEQELSNGRLIILGELLRTEK